MNNPSGWRMKNEEFYYCSFVCFTIIIIINLPSPSYHHHFAIINGNLPSSSNIIIINIIITINHHFHHHNHYHLHHHQNRSGFEHDKCGILHSLSCPAALFRLMYFLNVLSFKRRPFLMIPKGTE